MLTYAKRRWRLFVPILAGASLRDRVIACIGAMIGIIAAAWVGSMIKDIIPLLPYLVAPIGASAVLVFAVPASPLAQPWPVLGGNVISGVVGVTIAHWVGNPFLAAGIAVAGAILIMSLLRCLHPPGGAAALTAVIGGPAIVSSGYMFALTVVAANSITLLCAGWLFHRFSGHAYPHRVEPAASSPSMNDLQRQDIERALEETGETFDIAPADLEALLFRAEIFAEERRSKR